MHNDTKTSNLPRMKCAFENIQEILNMDQNIRSNQEKIESILAYALRNIKQWTFLATKNFFSVTLPVD